MFISCLQYVRIKNFVSEKISKIFPGRRIYFQANLPPPNKVSTDFLEIHNLCDSRQIWKTNFFDVRFVFISLKIFFFNNPFFQQVTSRADRENTTVIPACSAAVEYLPPPPMIVFMGKFIQTTWKPNHRHDYDNYPWLYANPSG